jgi:hypothetical protein
LEQHYVRLRELFNAVGFRSVTDSDGTPAVSPYAVFRNVLRWDVDTILQREYGISIDDFSADSDLAKKLYNEEYVLYEAVMSLKKDSDESTFNIAFSYKNGVTVQNGKSDRQTLDKMPTNFHFIHFLTIPASAVLLCRSMRTAQWRRRLFRAAMRRRGWRRTILS